MYLIVSPRPRTGSDMELRAYEKNGWKASMANIVKAKCRSNDRYVSSHIVSNRHYLP